MTVAVLPLSNSVDSLASRFSLQRQWHPVDDLHPNPPVYLTQSPSWQLNGTSHHAPNCVRHLTLLIFNILTTSIPCPSSLIPSSTVGTSFLLSSLSFWCLYTFQLICFLSIMPLCLMTLVSWLGVSIGQTVRFLFGSYLSRLISRWKSFSLRAFFGCNGLSYVFIIFVLRGEYIFLMFVAYAASAQINYYPTFTFLYSGPWLPELWTPFHIICWKPPILPLSFS